MKTVTFATLPRFLKTEDGKPNIESLDFLKNLGIITTKTNVSTLETVFPPGWTKEILTGPRAGWTVYAHKEANKDFYAYEHPITEGVSFICLINCEEEVRAHHTKVDPRIIKKPGNDYTNQNTAKKLSFERAGDKKGNPGC